MGRTSRAGLWRGLRVLVGLAAGLSAAGCAPSEEEIQDEFDDYVDGANSCSVASECGIAVADCPLGCFVAVRVDRVASVERKARELVDDYSSGGRNCVYTCVAAGEPECVRGRCAASGQ